MASKEFIALTFFENSGAAAVADLVTITVLAPAFLAVDLRFILFFTEGIIQSYTFLLIKNAK